jgi:hypothetical protein
MFWCLEAWFLFGRLRNYCDARPGTMGHGASAKNNFTAILLNYFLPRPINRWPQQANTAAFFEEYLAYVV